MKEVKEKELFVLHTSKRPYLVCIKYNKFGKQYELEFIAYREEQQ